MFNGPSYEVTHQNGQWLTLLPENQYQGMSGNNIIFKIPNAPGWYLDFNDTYILVEVKIMKPDDTPVAKELVAFENFALGTLFKDVSFTTSNQTKLEGETQSYAYRSYMYALINAPFNAKKFQLSIAGWSRDDAGKFDAQYTAAAAAVGGATAVKWAGNEGFHIRRQWTMDGSTIQLVGPVFLDTWMQQQYFIDDQHYNYNQTQ